MVVTKCGFQASTTLQNCTWPLSSRPTMSKNDVSCSSLIFRSPLYIAICTFTVICSCILQKIFSWIVNCFVGFSKDWEHVCWCPYVNNNFKGFFRIFCPGTRLTVVLFVEGRTRLQPHQAMTQLFWWWAPHYGMVGWLLSKHQNQSDRSMMVGW